MISLYFIRHAECEANLHPDVIGGRSPNSPLTEKGEMQAEQLRERFLLEGLYFDKVCASTAIRAKRTAELSLRGLYSLDKIIYSDSLQELSQGDWEGMKRDDVYTPDVLAYIRKNQSAFKTPNGESKLEVAERMYGLLDREFISNMEIEEYVKSDSIYTGAIYSHGIAINCLLQKIMKFDAEFVFTMYLDNTSITQIKYYDGRFWPKRIGDASHLYYGQQMAEEYANAYNLLKAADYSTKHNFLEQI